MLLHCSSDSREENSNRVSASKFDGFWVFLTRILDKGGVEIAMRMPCVTTDSALVSLRGIYSVTIAGSSTSSSRPAVAKSLTRLNLNKFKVSRPSECGSDDVIIQSPIRNSENMDTSKLSPFSSAKRKLNALRDGGKGKQYCVHTDSEGDNSSIDVSQVSESESESSCYF